jgi:hypothetical protein
MHSDRRRWAIRKVGGLTDDYVLPTSAEMTRAHPLRRLAEPWRDRHHLYREYADFLDRLAPLAVVPLREFGRARAADRAVFALRHDVDDRLESALEFARLEHERGLRATYFVLHSAPYYGTDALLPALRRLQDLGHEVGFHYDLVTSQVVRGVDPRAELQAELGRLRAAGLDVVGVAAHGSYWGHRLGYKNTYFFADLQGPEPGFPNFERVGDVELAKATLAEFGLDYDASALGETSYWTDSRVDRRGRRWHPRLADVESLAPGEAAIALVHSCHWDRSLAAKYARTLRRLARRAVAATSRRDTHP